MKEANTGSCLFPDCASFCAEEGWSGSSVLSLQCLDSIEEDI